MGGKSSSKIEVNHYLMSIHLGICLGPVDAITAAYYGEKKYWSGYNTTNQVYTIANTGLFGGDKKEGGVEGQMTVLMGRSDQVLPDNIAVKLGRPSGQDCPGFRGITSVFHTGPASGGRSGWYWAANSPYLKGMWYTVMAIPRTLGDQYSRINPTPLANGFRPAGYACRFYSREEYKPLSTGARSVAEIIKLADELSPSGAPHRVVVGTSQHCAVHAQVGDASGCVYATSANNNMSYAGLRRKGSELNTCLLWEAYRVGVGQGVAPTPQTVRPNVPTVYASPAPNSYDANPAHIIYEVMTNLEYGMGLDPSAIDTLAFTKAAKTLFDERLGLSMAWSTSTAAGDFIDEVKDHINALIFPDPETGKMTIKLVRPDYEEGALRRVDESNAVMTSFSRKAWGDTINEVTVTWTNPANEQEETVTLQDNGNIAEQGEVVSDTKNYYGVRSADLAWQLAARDLRVAAAPLCSAEIDLDRSFWDLRPGECLKVSWREYGIVDLVMRVWAVKYGSGRAGSGKITASLTEDVFALPVSAFVRPPTTEWVDTSKEPEVVSLSKVITIPVYMASAAGGVSASTFEYPAAYAGVLAAPPNNDTSSFELIGQSVDATGAVNWVGRGTKGVSGRGRLDQGLSAEAISSNLLFTVEFGSGPSQSVFTLIGDGDDGVTELALFIGSASAGWTMRRGVLDTVPREWPSGTPLWFIDPDFPFIDEAQQSAGSVPEYKLLTNTSLGQLSESSAPVVSAVLTDRMHLPLRPAGVTVEGVGFGEVGLPTTGKVEVVWARRNRLTEENVVLPWTGGDVTPENGQTTYIVVMDADNGSEVARIDGLLGTSTTVDIAALYPTSAYPSGVWIIAGAERDGLVSLQSHRVKVRLPQTGYGNDYGVSYG